MAPYTYFLRLLKRGYIATGSQWLLVWLLPICCARRQRWGATKTGQHVSTQTMEADLLRNEEEEWWHQVCAGVDYFPDFGFQILKGYRDMPGWRWREVIDIFGHSWPVNRDTLCLRYLTAFKRVPTTHKFWAPEAPYRITNQTLGTCSRYQAYWYILRLTNVL